MSSKLTSKCRAQWSLSSYQVWKKSVCKCLNTSQCLGGGGGGGEGGCFFINKITSAKFSPWLLNRWDKLSKGFITSNSIQIHWKLCEIIDTEVFAFLHSCDLESRTKSNRLVWNVEFNSSPYQVWANPFINVWMHTNVKVCVLSPMLKFS